MICAIRMDTLNTHMNANASATAMGTSETHSSEKTSASDEEDFKLNIPYFDEINGNEMNYGNNGGGVHQQQQQQQQQQSITQSFNAIATSPINADDCNQMNYTNWDNDDIYTDDNVSHIGSDYSAQSTSESPHLYQPSSHGAPAPLPPPSHYYNNDPNSVIDAKYPPSELLLQPPSRYTTLHYEMQQQQQHQQRRHYQSLPQPPPHLQRMHAAAMAQHQHQQHSHPHHHTQFDNQSEADIAGGGGGRMGSGSGAGPPPPPSYNQQQQQQQSAFLNHPNMWYPNAPYGSSSRYNYDPNRYPYHYNNTYGHDPMMDMLQLSNSGREARNRAEKNRRDKLNGSIQELSTMVPHVAESPRRVDKTAVLRFAAHGLRLKYVFGESPQPRTQLTDSLMKLLDSFFITLTCHGQIVLISSSIEQHLGHCQADLYGQNILHITHPEDHSMIKQQLIPNDLDNLFDVKPEDESGEPRLRTKAEEDLIDKKLREDKRSFTVRLARAGPRSEPTSYEVVRIDGCFRRSDEAPRGVKSNPFPTTLQLIRRSRGRDDSIPLHAVGGNDIVLIGIARIIRPPKVPSRAIETNSLEYKTRHLIDGRIIDCDQRIGIVAGYMTDEVRNLSPFTFMHQDDARWVIVALRQMYDCNSSYGESTYRLLSRNGSFIYLQSRGYLEIDKTTNKVHSFLCINTLLSEEEGRRRVSEMKRKFSIIINAQIPPSSDDAPASENPQQLENAVMRLIENLQKSSDDEESYENDAAIDNGSSRPAIEYYKAKAELLRRSQSHRTSISNSNTPGTSKTPPIALVPPELDSVKSSISKSVSVVNVTAARNLRCNSQRLKSPISTTEDDDDDDDDNDDDDRVVGSSGGYGGSGIVSSSTNTYDTSQKSSKQTNCSCANSLNSGDLCNYCQRYEYIQQTTVDRSNRKHKFSESFSNDADDELPIKRSLCDTDLDQILSSPSDHVDQSIESEIKDIMEMHDRNNDCGGNDMMNDQFLNENQLFAETENEYESHRIPDRFNIDASTTDPITTTTTSNRSNDNDDNNDYKQS